MKKLSIILLLLICVQFVSGQERIPNSPIEGEYMEIRVLKKQGFSYRLAPDLPFQKTGLFHKNLKPYFKQYDESLRYQKMHNRSILGIVGGATLYGAGTSTILLGGLTNNVNAVKIGGVAFISGLGLTIWSNHVNSRSIYKAADAYNRNKNPSIEGVEYLEAIPHPFLMWKFRTSPTDEYKYVGLYGSKLKPFLEENEAAYDAYKRYRIGNLSYTLGNIGSLVGTGMILNGFLNRNTGLSRNGLIISGSSFIATIIGSNMMRKNIYQSMDLFNYQNSPTINSSLIPSIQPSSHSAGLGLVWNIE